VFGLELFGDAFGVADALGAGVADFTTSASPAGDASSFCVQDSLAFVASSEDSVFECVVTSYPCPCSQVIKSLFGTSKSRASS
jgi:hypothetical protein